MAISSWKVTMSFSVGPLGWRELLYYFADGATLADVQRAISPLMADRRGILAPNCALDKVSVVQIADNPQSDEIFTDTVVGPGTYVSGDICDNPYLAIIATIHDASRRWHRQYLLRGLPFSAAAIIDDNNKLAPIDAVLRTAVQEYLDSLQTVATGTPTLKPDRPWAMYARATSSFQPLQRTLISDVYVGGDGFWRILVATGATLGKGVRIHIHGFTGCAFVKSIDGDTVVMGADTGTPPYPAPSGFVWWRINRRECCKANLEYNKRAVVVAYQKNLVPFAYGDILNIAIRKTGVAPLHRKGRRPKSCCR